MTTQISDDLVEKIEIRDLISYLRYSPIWHEVAVKEGWQLFVSDQSSTGVELELLLPEIQDKYVFPAYASNAVNVLSQLKNEQPELTIERVQNVSRDVLLVRNVDPSSKGSLPLQLAAKQVSGLRTLIKQSANSERDALPYYQSTYRNSMADRMTNEFRFGHTQDRSFGFVVQSPILGEPIRWVQQSLFNMSDNIEPDAPISRRILERVIRGLVRTKNAVKQEHLDSLVGYYESGFSSNMCKTVIDISRNETATVEYSVLWSPKITPPNDIAEVAPVLLTETDYAYLSNASKEMVDLKPDDTFTVRGLVTGNRSQDNPNLLDSGQAIVIEWLKPDTERKVGIIVEMKPKDYIDALHAHEKWYPVEVTGEAKFMGGRWRLLNPRDFRIVPKGE